MLNHKKKHKIEKNEKTKNNNLMYFYFFFFRQLISLNYKLNFN